MTTKKDQYFSKTLAKGLKVLSLFNEQTPVWTQTEVANILDINMTSTYRLINTLVKLGYLHKGKDSKKLRLGLGAMAMAATHQRAFDGHHMIKSLVDDFYEKHNVTVDVALVVEGTLTVVYRREIEGTLTYQLPAVSRALHTSALGKAYLSFLNAEGCEKVIDQLSFEPRTKKSITNRKQLLEELAAVRARGFAVSDEEFLPGLISLGAPLIGQEAAEAVGAISLDYSTIQQNIHQMTQNFSEPLMNLSRDLSAVMTSA